MNARLIKLGFALLAAGALALLLAPLLPAATTAEVNFNALRTATTVGQTDDLLLNWNSNSVYRARRIAYSYVHAALTNASATIASNVISAFSNNQALYVRPSGYAVGTRGRADKPWNSVSNALVAAQNGDTVFIFPGSYTNQHTNLFKNSYNMAGCADPIFYKTNLTLIGLGNPTVWYARTNSGMVIYNSSNVVVDGLNFASIGIYTTNMTTAMGNSGLLSLSDSEVVSIKSCAFSGPHMFGIIEEGQTRPSTNSVRITDCTFSEFGQWIPGYGWDGAGMATGGWIVDGCYFTRCARGVEIYPNIGGWTGRAKNSVRNCTFRDLVWNAVLDGWTSQGSTQIEVQNNTMYNDFNNPSVAGSNVWSYGGPAIAFGGGSLWTITGNSIRGFSSGIWLGTSYGCSNVICTGNNISLLWHYGGQGITLGEVGKVGRDAVIAHNVIGDGTNDTGIRLVAPTECRVFGNIIGATKLGSSTGKGIRIYDGTNVFLDGNTIIDSQAAPTTQYGISVENNSTNIVAGYNQIRGFATAAIMGPILPIESRWGIPPNRTLLTDLFGIERFTGPEGMFSDENFSSIASQSQVQTNIAQNGTCTQQPYPATWTNAYERLGYRRLGATNGPSSYSSVWRGYQATMASQRLGTNWWYETMFYPEHYGATTPTNLNFWAGFSSSATANAPAYFVGFHMNPVAASTTNLYAIVRTNNVPAYSNQLTFPIKTNVYLRLGVQGNTNNTVTFFTNGVSCGTVTVAFTNLGYQLVAPAVYCGMVQTNLTVASSNALSVRFLRAYTGE